MESLMRTLIFLCVCFFNAASSDTTTIAFSKNAKDNVKLYINIVNPLDTRVLVNMSTPGNPSCPTIQRIVKSKDAITIPFDRTYFEIVGSGKSDKGILVQSNGSGLVISGLSTSADSGDMYLARNITQLGTEYGVITHCNLGDTCQFAVIALENDIVLEIMFPQYFTSSGTNYYPGDVMTLPLQQLQTFQIQMTSDLSGVRILSKNKTHFSVLCGSSLTTVQNGRGRDHIADMVPPTTSWGKDYVLVQLKRNSYSQNVHDQIKFLAGVRSINISILGCGFDDHHTILAFQTYIYNMICERIKVSSDEPFLVAHIPIAEHYSDPAMFFPTPVHHYVSEYTVYIPPNFTYCAISLVTETRHVNTFNLGKFSKSFTEWERVEKTAYSTAWLTNIGTGIVEIKHTSPFGGHAICEKEWINVAFTIGFGNVTLNESEEASSTRTMSASATIQNDHETLIATWRPTETSSSNATDNVTTSQTHSNESSLNCTCCDKPAYLDPGPPSTEKMLEMINDLKKTLTVQKKRTSNYVRKLTSALDERASSKAIGTLGIIVLCAVFGSVIVLDIATLFQKRNSVNVAIL